MIELNIHNETSNLKSVLLGITLDFGGTPILSDCYDPKSKEHVLKGTFPLEEDIDLEINEFLNILKKYSVRIFRPKNIKGLNQIFTRDIVFVIGDKLILPNIIFDRINEIDAIDHLFNDIENSDLIRMPEGTRMEGGDLILYNNYIFVGYSEEKDFNKYDVARTNKCAVDFLRSNFPNKEIISFELNKSDNNPRKNALHLDCCFQTIGKDMAIIHKESFKNIEDVNFLLEFFGRDKILFVTDNEMYNMGCNVFSISEKIIVSEKGSKRINNELKRRGFIVEEINYFEIGKMEGLFRCSTMPLERR